jgi:hypothetical protein
MQTFTVQVKGNSGLKALHALEEEQVISIIENADFDSPSLPGRLLGLKAFKNWIGTAENAPTIDLKEAKVKWVNKRKQLRKPAK